MAEENIGANVPEVAEPVTSPAEDNAVNTPPAEGSVETKGEPATTSPKQSAEANSKFAQMRREMEAASKRSAELEKKLADHEELSRAIGDLYGYKGAPLQVKDMLIANDRGISVEQLAAERAAEEAKNRKMVESDPEYQRVMQENERLQQALVRDLMAKDFDILKSAHPDLKATSIEDLGEDFAKLRGLGWDAKEAYAAIQAKEKANMKTPPPSTGSVKTSVASDKEFYTPEEVDRITREDLRKDPTLIDKIKRSMARW